jgi:hypothetical protein
MRLLHKARFHVFIGKKPVTLKAHAAIDARAAYESHSNGTTFFQNFECFENKELSDARSLSGGFNCYWAKPKPASMNTIDGKRRKGDMS